MTTPFLGALSEGAAQAIARLRCEIGLPDVATPGLVVKASGGVPEDFQVLVKAGAGRTHQQMKVQA
jgi:hypothetical protein